MAKSHSQPQIAPFTVIGTRPIRHDGLKKVTGTDRYGADIQLPGLLHGKFLRSPYAHAQIVSIDYSRALTLPGVKAVVTSSDMPLLSSKLTDQSLDPVYRQALENHRFHSDNILAREKVLYRGHAVAAVAATSPHIAEEALALIDVEYQSLPSVLDAKSAMEKDSPPLHKGLATESGVSGPGGTDDTDSPGTNVAKHFTLRVGDISQGFEEADIVVEREFVTEAVHQGYIEPHSATAFWDADDNVTIWSSTQAPFHIRDQTAQLLGLSPSKIKMVPMEIGGGFGGKTKAILEPVTALLSHRTGTPVKLTMTRSEVFVSTGPASATHLRVKMGSTTAGLLTAAEAHLVYEAGAFPGSPVGGGARQIFAPYDVPNVYIEGFDVLVNKPKVAAYRAPGASQAAFAAEQVIDEISEKLGKDPLEFRLRNAAKEGTEQVSGTVHGPIGYTEVLKAVRDHPHYKQPLGGPNRGRGVACGTWHTNSAPSSAVATVNPDGTVSLSEGSPDIGGGRVAIAMQLAETLGIPVEAVRPTVVDTDSVGYTYMTTGSSTMFKTGWACIEAAMDIRRQLIERATTIWGAGVEEVEYNHGILRHKTNPDLQLTFQELASLLLGTGGSIVGRGSVNPAGGGDCLAAHIADVEVDHETGKVTVLRYTAVQDVGTAVHPSYVEGQIQGGVAQGIGWALNEEYVYSEEGQMLNTSFLDYRMPTALDMPFLDTVLIETPNPMHPFGLRGVGELPIVPPPAAIANAIYNAIGVRTGSLPMKPSQIIEALARKATS